MSHWIPVTERLPDIGEPVLAYFGETGSQEVLWRWTDNPPTAWSNGVSRVYEGVTHWRPLPPPPGQEQSIFVNVMPPDPGVRFIPVLIEHGLPVRE